MRLDELQADDWVGFFWVSLFAPKDFLLQGNKCSGPALNADQPQPWHHFLY